MPPLFPPDRSSLLLVMEGVAPRPVLTPCGNAREGKEPACRVLGITVSAAETQPSVTSSRAERSEWCGAYTHPVRVIPPGNGPLRPLP